MIEVEVSGTTPAAMVDAPMQPSLRWGAILAGWLVATGVAFLLYIAGLALGFAMFDPYDAQATAKGIGIGTAVWMVLTWTAALFLGGMFASWFDGRDDQTIGCMHGVTVWGLSVSACGLLLLLGLGGAIAGAGAGLAGGARGHGAVGPILMGGHGGPGGGTAGNDAVIRLQAQLAQRVAGSTAAGAPPVGMQPGMQSAVPGVRTYPLRADPATVRAATVALLGDRTDTASALLVANAAMSQTQADQIVQGLSPQVKQAQAQLKAATDKVAHYTAMALGMEFLSALLALIAAALGGWLGAGHVHRVYHLQRYPRRTAVP